VKEMEGGSWMEGETRTNAHAFMRQCRIEFAVIVVVMVVVVVGASIGSSIVCIDQARTLVAACSAS
jgi:uncharacterized membrane protein YfcA